MVTAPAAVRSPILIAALVIASENENIAVRSVVPLRIEGNTLALRLISCCVPLIGTEFPQYIEHSTLSPVAIRDEKLSQLTNLVFPESPDSQAVSPDEIRVGRQNFG